ncbi:cytosolic 5'-nucleotidase 1A-like isoform X2 [Phyllopteryx taeniolatus]|nr:cytosolic 5'-nucleotidase 1A-like isoform X2 [Phyllopteryx taeniolatus]XP_061650206.1 cytosolic 5'-nucleotidase 1A-like isoform X2 [Phyllopteryx taeniolatus]XP_061650207.1 cytosolic 5'-nucleotidase 1A-like isoform X2 [Phyllopteryx taeniolatus]
MEREQQIYERQGMEEYLKYQLEHESEPFSPGPAFSFVKALEAVNNRLRELYSQSEELFDVVLVTNNHAYVGLRLINTINHHRELHDTHYTGPLKGFLEALGKLQRKFFDKGLRMDCPIRTYLVTARSAASSGTRALKTLRSWGLEIDEALFLAGAPKGPMLEKIRPHIFFDDQMFHVEGAAELGTVACHVPYGVAQRAAKK